MCKLYLTYDNFYIYIMNIIACSQLQFPQKLRITVNVGAFSQLDYYFSKLEFCIIKFNKFNYMKRFIAISDIDLGEFK